MKQTGNDSLIKYLEFYYDLLRDEIIILENRMNILISICGILIVLVSGLITYILKTLTSKYSIPLFSSLFLFIIFVISCSIIIIFAIAFLYPRTAPAESIKESNSNIQWGKELKVDNFGDYVDHWMMKKVNDTQEFIKETYIKSLWAKEILRNKRIKLLKITMLLFLIAIICLLLALVCMLFELVL